MRNKYRMNCVHHVHYNSLLEKIQQKKIEYENRLKYEESKLKQFDQIREIYEKSCIQCNICMEDITDGIFHYCIDCLMRKQHQQQQSKTRNEKSQSCNVCFQGRKFCSSCITRLSFCPHCRNGMPRTNTKFQIGSVKL